MLDILWGILGIVVVLGISFLFSNNKRKINWRTILVGIGVNIVFAFLIIKWSFGQYIFGKITDVMNTVVSYGHEGILFLFDGLSTEEGDVTAVTAISVISMIIFFASLIAVLYHYGIMQFIIKYLGGAISKLFGTTKEESTSAAANIFMGHTEAPLVIKPFLNKITNSELFAVMTGGLASVAGTMLALYATLGVPMKYLLIASFMSAASGLVIAKMFFPYVETSSAKRNIEDIENISFEDDDNEVETNQEGTVNVVDAAQTGAVNGMHIGLAVVATLLALVSIIALLNGILGFIGNWFGINLSMQLIFGYIFSPIAFAIGVPWTDAITAGSYVGDKLVLTEIVAFKNLMDNSMNLEPKTVAVMSIALCSFANFGSMGSLISMLGSIAPKRKKVIAKMAFKSIIAGVLATLLSASIAGMFF